MGTRKGGRLRKLARETQLNTIIRSLSDSYSPNDRATADLPYEVEAALEAFEKAGVPFPQEPHEVKRILRQGAPAVLREYQRLKDAEARQTRGPPPDEVSRRHPEPMPRRSAPADDVALGVQRHRLLQSLAGLVDLKREALEDEVARLLREDAPIQAIKRYRELTGVGLKEAKEAVEVRLRSRRALPDETAPRPAAWRSWAWLVVAAVLLGLGLLAASGLSPGR